MYLFVGQTVVKRLKMSLCVGCGPCLAQFSEIKDIEIVIGQHYTFNHSCWTPPMTTTTAMTTMTTITTKTTKTTMTTVTTETAI